MTVIVKFLSLLLYSICQIDKKKKNKEKKKAKKNKKIKHDNMISLTFGFQGFCLPVFVLCLVCSMLTVSVQCPFLVALSFFSNVSLKHQKHDGVTSGPGTAYHSGASVYSPGLEWDSCCSIFNFLCWVSTKSLLVQLSFFHHCTVCPSDYTFGIFSCIIITLF